MPLSHLTAPHSAATRSVTTYLAAALLGACGDPETATPGDGFADSQDAQDTRDASSDLGPLPSWEDDEALLAWLGAVVALCPPTSLSTAPGLWHMSLLTEWGCTVRHPEEWLPTLQSGYFEVTTDASRQVGYAVISTYLEGIDWTEVTLGDHLVASLQQDYPGLSVLAADTSTDPYGLGVRFRVIILKFELSGVPTLGVAKLVHSECSPILGLCPLTASLTWAPAAELPVWACVLAQIEATLHCPSGGGTTCDEADCNSSCQSEGSSGGTCVGDQCMCY